MKFILKQMAHAPMIYQILVDLRALYLSSKSRLFSILSGFKPLNREEFKYDKDILFILGSGSSVNKLTDEHWAVIKEQVSIGINFWVLHKFIPDFYSIENPGDKKVFQVYKEAFQRKDIQEKKPYILFFSKKNSFYRGLLPHYLLSNIRTYTRISSSERKRNDLKKSIRKIFNRMKSGRLPSNILYGQGASLERLVCFGIFLGVKKIVLVGVDLNNVSYFWENSGLFDNIDSGQNGTLHKTADPDKKRLTVIDTLPLLSEILKEDYSIELFIESDKSMLAGPLRVFSWQS